MQRLQGQLAALQDKALEEVCQTRPHRMMLNCTLTAAWTCLHTVDQQGPPVTFCLLDALFPTKAAAPTNPNILARAHTLTYTLVPHIAQAG